MNDVELVISLPADVAASLGETAEEVACAARQAVILHLLRAGDVSQARAAALLGLTRHDILDLMAEQDIASGPQTIDEYRRDIEQAAEFVRNRVP
jgi:hypothetical protein